MYQKILVPLDGSPVAEEAIPYALELRRLSGGTITLVRVVPYSRAAAELWLARQWCASVKRNQTDDPVGSGRSPSAQKKTMKTAR